MINIVINYFVKILSIKEFRIINDYFLHIILRAKGYKNFGSFKDTGEEFFFKKLSKFKLNTCLDIGAHSGNYSQMLIKKLNANVIAIEPMKDPFVHLLNIKKKEPLRFFPYNYAFSNKIGYKYIYFPNKNSQLTTLCENYNKINFLKKKKFRSKKIKVITLDYFVKKNSHLFENGIDLIKIDTEGNDYNVLLGGINTIAKYKPKFIQFEMNYHNIFSSINLYKIYQLFKNYKIFRILPYNNGFIEVDPSRPENNIFHLSNYILVKKSIKFL
jgi:FkbM family methyltransferase